MANIKKNFNFRNGVQVDDDNLLVTSTGLVGIGTTVPTEALDVRGNATISGFTSITNASIGIVTITTLDPSQIIGAGVSIKSGIITAQGAGIVTFFGDARFLQGMPTSQWQDVDVGLGYTSIFNTGGNVGIATTDPRTSMQVGNNVDAGQKGVGISSAGNINASGIISATSFVGDFTGNIVSPSTFSGNVTLNADFDVDGHTNLDNVNIVGVATVTGEINIPDKSGSSNWITFGDGEDLKIWHSGTSGHLNNITGDLYIQGAPNNGSKVIIAAAGGGSDLARFTVGGGVNLYYNGSGRLSTRADGVRTYGTLEAANLNVTGVTTAVTVDVNGDLDVDGHTNLDNVSVAGVVTATSYYGDGSNLSNVISGVDVKFEGASVGTGVTMLNFVGFNTVTAPASGLSTITSGQNLTIGVRSGSAVEASLTGTSFNVIARSGGNIAINI